MSPPKAQAYLPTKPTGNGLSSLPAKSTRNEAREVHHISAAIAAPGPAVGVVESPLVFSCPARGSDWSRQKLGLGSVRGLVYHHKRRQRFATCLSFSFTSSLSFSNQLIPSSSSHRHPTFIISIAIFHHLVIVIAAVAVLLQ